MGIGTSHYSWGPMQGQAQNRISCRVRGQLSQQVVMAKGRGFQAQVGSNNSQRGSLFLRIGDDLITRAPLHDYTKQTPEGNSFALSLIIVPTSLS